MTSKQEQFYRQQIADMQVENAALQEQVAELLKVNAELVGKVLKLSKNSSNSSKPQSSDIVKPPNGFRRIHLVSATADRMPVANRLAKIASHRLRSI